MIQVGTKLNVVDNTGVKFVKCIKVLGGTRKKNAHINDIILVSIKKSSFSSKIKEGCIYKAVIVRTKKNLLRRDGTIIKFYDNSVVLLDKEENIVGTRIFGLIPEEMKSKKWSKIISLAKEVI